MLLHPCLFVSSGPTLTTSTVFLFQRVHFQLCTDEDNNLHQQWRFRELTSSTDASSFLPATTTVLSFLPLTGIFLRHSLRFFNFVLRGIFNLTIFTLFFLRFFIFLPFTVFFLRFSFQRFTFQF